MKPTTAQPDHDDDRLHATSAGDVLVASDERASTMLPADLIGDDEIIILMLRPSPLFIILAPLQTMLGIALATLVLAYLSTIAWIGWTDTQAFALGVTIGIARLCWQALEWYCRIYVLTDRRLIRRRGVLRVMIFETALSRIQHTSVIAHVRERIFALGSIGFATAGSSTYEAFWSMIAQPYAVHRIVVDAIRRYGGRNHHTSP